MLDLEKRNPFFALIEAIYDDDAERIARLLPRVNVRTNGDEVLCAAIRKNNLLLIDKLVDMGCSGSTRKAEIFLCNEKTLKYLFKKIGPSLLTEFFTYSFSCTKLFLPYIDFASLDLLFSLNAHKYDIVRLLIMFCHPVRLSFGSGPSINFSALRLLIPYTYPTYSECFTLTHNNKEGSYTATKLLLPLLDGKTKQFIFTYSADNGNVRTTKLLLPYLRSYTRAVAWARKRNNHSTVRLLLPFSSLKGG